MLDLYQNFYHLFKFKLIRNTLSGSWKEHPEKKRRG